MIDVKCTQKPPKHDVQLSKRINFAIKAERKTRMKYSAQNETSKHTSVQGNPKQ